MADLFYEKSAKGVENNWSAVFPTPSKGSPRALFALTWFRQWQCCRTFFHQAKKRQKSDAFCCDLIPKKQAATFAFERYRRDLKQWNFWKVQSYLMCYAGLLAWTVLSSDWRTESFEYSKLYVPSGRCLSQLRCMTLLLFWWNWRLLDEKASKRVSFARGQNSPKTVALS